MGENYNMFHGIRRIKMMRKFFKLNKKFHKVLSKTQLVENSLKSTNRKNYPKLNFPSNLMFTTIFHEMPRGNPP
jgi:hypothetical protein